MLFRTAQRFDLGHLWRLVVLLVLLGRLVRSAPSVPVALFRLLGLLALLALPVLLGLCRLSALLGLPAPAARLVLARLRRRLLRSLVVALRSLPLRVRSFPALRRSSAIRWWALWGQLSMPCRTPFLWSVVWVKSILRRRRRTN